MKDAWNTGTSYEEYVGRWSRVAAREFLAWLRVPDGGRWLDVGCGTGALTQAILEQSNPTAVMGVDPSAEFITYARENIRDPRGQYEVAELESLSGSGERFDAVVSGLALNFMPHPESAVSRMRDLTRPGGTVAAYVWDYAGGMQFMRYFWDAAAVLDPQAAALDEGQRFPICQPEALRGLFRAASLQQVNVHALLIATEFAGFEDFWQPFLGGQGPAPSYVVSLSEHRREHLRERLRAALPFTPDGRIHLTAKAWAVKGTHRGNE